MSISVEAVRFDDPAMWIDLKGKPAIGDPLAWYPALLHAAPEGRDRLRIGGTGQGLQRDHQDKDALGKGPRDCLGDVAVRHPVAA